MIEEDAKATILIADDEPSVADLLKTILTKDGHTIHVAANGTEAVRLAGEISPDLILMDISMPEMDGYEATGQIKAIEGMQEVPVIFLTGRSAQEDGGRAFARGGLTFVRKPFTNQQIRDLVNLALQSL